MENEHIAHPLISGVIEESIATMVKQQCSRETACVFAHFLVDMTRKF